MTPLAQQIVNAKPCPCGRAVRVFLFYEDPTEAGAHINLECSGNGEDYCPLNLSLTHDVESEEDALAFMTAWNTPRLPIGNET